MLLPADRGPEVAQSAPERPTDFGQPLRAENQQSHDENEQQVCRLEKVADH
jgi:hypothetical protein